MCFSSLYFVTILENISTAVFILECDNIFLTNVFRLFRWKQVSQLCSLVCTPPYSPKKPNFGIKYNGLHVHDALLFFSQFYISLEKVKII